MRVSPSFSTLPYALLLATAFSTVGCGETPTDSPPAQVPGSSTLAPAPSASPTTPTVPAPPTAITRCAGGEVLQVATERARPEVVLGRSHVAILHRARRRGSSLDEACEPWQALSVAALPMREGAFEQTTTRPVCGSGHFDGDYAATFALGASLVGDDLYAHECKYDEGMRYEANPEEPSMMCRSYRPGLERPWDGTGFDISTINALERDRARVRLERHAVGSHHVFVAAISGMDGSSGVFARVMAAPYPRTARIGFAPSGDIEDPRVFAFEVLPRAEGGTEITYGPRQGPQRIRIAIGADGVAGERESYEGVVAPPAFDVVMERGGRGVPPKLRIARTGVTSPLPGVSETVGTFAPSLAPLGERRVLVWSEGLNDATRIRVAVLDPVTGTLAGPITDLSTPGVEAGFATVAAHGDRVISAWDEKLDGQWRVVTTELRCE